MDEVKIVESIKLQVFSNPSKTGSPNRTLPPPPGLCPDFESWPNSYILERALYKHLHLQRLSTFGHSIFLLNKLSFFILRGPTHSPLELPLQVLVKGLSEARIQVSYVIHHIKLILAIESSSSALITLGALVLDG
jgi:hypothetical protein